MPEKFLKKINERILPQWKVCFITCVIVGLFAHLYKIANWLPNWDSLVFRYDPQNMIGLGRWFLPVVCSFSSFYDLPFLNGIIAIIFHGLGAVCICKILSVQKKITAALIGAVVVTFPTVISVMMYNYVADGYSIAFFLSTLAALCLTRKKVRYYVLGAFFITLSTGIYQAYITVTITLVLLKLIDEVIYDNVRFRVILKKGFYALIAGIAGMVAYAGILTVLLNIFSADLLDYQGINSTVSLAGLDLHASFYVVKETFVKCFFDLTDGVNVYVILNTFMLVFTLVYYLKYVVKNMIYKKHVTAFVLLILGTMLVIGAGALAFVNASVDYHNLMLMGYSSFYLFFLMLYERGEEENEVHTSIKCWTVLVVAILLVANQVVISNVSYHKAQMAYERSYGVLVRIADRIEELPDIEKCDRVLVIGALDNSHAYSVNLTPDITGITDGYIIRADDETVGQSVLCSALNDYCEKDYEFLSGEEKLNLMARDEVRAMEEWPSKTSIAIVDDIVVIKLSAEGEK